MKRSCIAILIIVLIPVVFVLTNSGPAAGRESVLVEKRETLRHDERRRTYEIRIPQGVGQNGNKVPLVLVLHGGGGNGRNAEKMTGFTQKAAREGFIVVYPEGTGRWGLLTWNASHCCGYAMEKKVDDIGFINAILDKLTAEYPVDPKRIYITGLSNGGMMTHRLGIALSNRLAAIAPVIATLFGDESKPVQPLSALMINGMLDQSVPYLGGAPGGRFPKAWDGRPAKPAFAQASFWASVNGCDGNPDTENLETLVVTRYRCPDSRNVALYLVKDSGHAWPGGKPGSHRGDKPGMSINATDIIWDFFKDHKK